MTAFLPRPVKIVMILRRSYAKMGWQAGLSAMADDLFENTRLLGDFLSDYYKGYYRDIEPWKMAVIAAGIGYFASPVDLIPDTLIFIGLIDDIAIMTWLLSTLSEELDKYRAWNEQDPAAPGSFTYRDS